MGIEKQKVSAKNISGIIYMNLKALGAIEWYSNSSSYYIKFKDCRIGSIRISDHKSRERYSYKWDLDVNAMTMEDLRSVVNGVKAKAKFTNEFDPEKYICWLDGKYQEVKDFEEYKKVIHNKK